MVLQQIFQIAGLTVLIPKDQIEIIDVKPEDAMKFVVSGGMTLKKRNNQILERIYLIRLEIDTLSQ